MTLPQVAAALGPSVRTLNRLLAARVIVPVEPSRSRRAALYDPLDCARRIIAHRAEQSPRDRRDAAQAELYELRIARERGELVPRAVYIRHGQRLASAFKAKVRALPNRLARVGVTPTEAEMLAAVDELLLEISQWANEADVIQAAELPEDDGGDAP
jgi:hypothetical protein